MLFQTSRKSQRNPLRKWSGIRKKFNFFQHRSSVTRWLDYFSNFWPKKVCHFDEMFAKVGLQFCQILNKPYKDCQKVLNCRQSGEISPNLVTLQSSDTDVNKIHSVVWMGPKEGWRRNIPGTEDIISIRIRQQLWLTPALR